MQSSDSKTKRTQKSEKKPKSAIPEVPANVSEEVAKVTRKTASKKAAGSTTSAVKQHRGAAKKVAATQQMDTTPTASVSYEEVAKLAYSYWAERGFQGGSPEEDWFRAECALRAR